MEAKDTVMTEGDIREFYKRTRDSYAMLLAQAEISFNAGQEAEREIIRYVALNYPTKTAIQIIDNLDGLRPRGGQCTDNTTYKYDGPEYTR